jgi:hypothetical protein
VQIVTDPRHLLPNFIDFIHGSPRVRVQRACHVIPLDSSQREFHPIHSPDAAKLGGFWYLRKGANSVQPITPR